MQVLQTIPWDKVDIEVLTVETNHAGEIFPGTKQEIREYLAEQNYVHAATLGKGTVQNKKYHNLWKKSKGKGTISDHKKKTS